MNTRVLVIDDAALFRRAISQALTSIPGVEVIGTAVNGHLGLARIAELQPDLVTLDIEMPDMTGIAVLKEMAVRKLTCGVIVLSAFSQRGRDMTVEALEAGAFDFVAKPEGQSAQESVAALRERLLPVVASFRRRNPSKNPAPVKAPPSPLAHNSHASSSPAINEVVTYPPRTGLPLVLIAVSTGGPAALAQLLPALPADLPAPVLIVQHMPPLFTQSLAKNLAGKSKIAITEAVDGEFAAPHCAYIAPGGRQLKLLAGLHGEYLLRVTDDPPENNCRPAADYLFRSAAASFPGRSLAVVLTGMGSDGTLGLRVLKQSGCYAIAQDEATSTVFGMPAEAIAAGLVDAVLPLNQIASAIVRALGGRR